MQWSSHVELMNTENSSSSPWMNTYSIHLQNSLDVMKQCGVMLDTLIPAAQQTETANHVKPDTLLYSWTPAVRQCFIEFMSHRGWGGLGKSRWTWTVKDFFFFGFSVGLNKTLYWLWDILQLQYSNCVKIIKHHQTFGLFWFVFVMDSRSIVFLNPGAGML